MGGKKIQQYYMNGIPDGTLRFYQESSAYHILKKVPDHIVRRESALIWSPPGQDMALKSRLSLAGLCSRKSPWFDSI